MRPTAVPGNSPVSGRRSLPKGAQQGLANVIAEARRAMIAVGMMSAVLNVLLLGGSLYMMGVYDMVLPSHSVPTLVGLATLVLVVYIFQGIIDFLRSRALLHFSATVVIELNREIHRLVGLVSRLQNNSDGLQPVRDLDQLRGFLSSQGPTALVDLPWILFFGGILFLLHPYLGMTVLLGGLILVGITLLTEKLTSQRNQELVEQNTQRMQVAETTRRHVEVIVANGMQERIGDRWITASNRHLALQDELSSVVLTLGNSTKVLRMALQSAVLTVGALLVLQGEASGGVIFAASILSSRALAPVEAAIGNWRSFVGARQSWKRLKDMLAAAPAEVEVVLLPPPQRDLAVESLALSPPGSGVVTLHGISFRLHAGEAMAILGPSGSGKSSLVRGLTGIWPLASGSVRLDGAELTQWPPDALGCHIGYVPQNVELIDGTIAQNISRFDPHATPEAIIEAATLAGVHDLVLHLPQGYNSDVGTDGRLLSGGQRQRIALARAMYGNPFLIVLDEPNSNLDQDGEDALAEAIAQARKRGAIVVAVAHRPSILHSVDLVLILSLGQAVAFGPTEKLVPQLIDNKRPQKETA